MAFATFVPLRPSTRIPAARCTPRRPRARCRGDGWGPAVDTLAALRTVYGDEGDGYARWTLARAAAEEGGLAAAHGVQHLVYGEADVSLLARALDAAEVSAGERFVDTGSGFGRAVLEAALLYPGLSRATGIEVVPALTAGACERLTAMRRLAGARLRPVVEFVCADYAAPPCARILRDADIAFCFATTWGDPHAAELDALSRTLAARMRRGARAIVVDKRLCARHGWALKQSFDALNADTGESSVHVYLLTGEGAVV